MLAGTSRSIPEDVAVSYIAEAHHEQAAVTGGVPLPKPPGVLRRWLTANTGLVNGAIVVCFLLGSALMWVVSSVDTETITWPEWTWVFPIAAVAAALWWRTRTPLVGVIVTVACGFGAFGTLHLAIEVALAFFLYALPVYRGVRAGWIGFAVAAIGNALSVIATELPPLLASGSTANVPHAISQMLGYIIPPAIWYLAVLLIGINMGNRKRYVQALVDRAEQLVRERAQQQQLAATAERARIAREMHDIVAHSLSVVVTLTEAASVTVDQQPAAAKLAMERAAETGRGALAEMRRLLGVLNEGSEGDRAPQPQLTDLPQLLAGFREAGLRVTHTELGVSHGDSSQQVAVFRILQEALTNALKYAGPGALVTVDVQHRIDETAVTITDGGSPQRGHEPLPGSGHGLQGAVQRAQLFGGELQAGPYGTGWRVTARVPVRMAAGATQPTPSTPTAPPTPTEPLTQETNTL